jgi:tRNA 2-thiouridine synthesizing protein A
MSDVLIDARGLRCPWPALRLARAMREGGSRVADTIVADDPAAPRELAALAAERGWSIMAVDSELGAAHRIESAPAP